MQNIKFIQYGTKDYQDTLKLRNKVMRIPLGLDIYKEDLSFEKKSIIIAFFDNGHLLRVGVMSNKSSVYKIEYLCFVWMLEYRQKNFIYVMDINQLEMFFC